MPVSFNGHAVEDGLAFIPWLTYPALGLGGGRKTDNKMQGCWVKGMGKSGLEYPERGREIDKKNDLAQSLGEERIK